MLSVPMGLSRPETRSQPIAADRGGLKEYVRQLECAQC
jgi:hypothetical protein